MSEIDHARGFESGPSKLLEVDFALVIARLIETARADPAQLRSSIYELARRKLEEQFAGQSAAETQRAMQALETAIQGVEDFSIKIDSRALPDHASVLAPLAAPTRGYLLPAGLEADNSRQASPHILHHIDARSDSPSPRRRPGGMRLTLASICLIAGLSLIYLENRYQLLKAPLLKSVSAAPPAAPAATLPAAPLPAAPAPSESPAAPQGDAAALRGDRERPARRNGPLPTSFGIYALSNDQLFDLDLLPGRPPDIRIAVSAALSFPSKATLPDGKVRFIVFRRDWANDPPDRAEVRIVARLQNSASGSVKTSAASAPDLWIIRNIAFALRVAPVSGQPEMYEIRNDDPDFTLPSGRYALVVKNSAYDFTVQGTVSDTRQCLQRIEAVNGIFYHECRPQG